MRFSGEGYIIKVRSHGEKSAVVTLITPQNGKIVCYASGARLPRNLGTYQAGNYISFNAWARVEENMLCLGGVELLRSHAADFMFSAEKTDALASLCGLLDECVAENDSLGAFYTAVDDFFTHINDANWLVYYSFFEYYLLDFLGIGLDISECAVTGRRSGLKYVSPKTGRAVCAEVGAPYKDRLFAYPQYIADRNYSPQYKEVSDVLAMTGSFLQKNFLSRYNLRMPELRSALQGVAKTYMIRGVK